MESTQLTEFYNSVQQFPKSSMELNTLTEQLMRLMGAPFVAILVDQDKESPPTLGFRFAQPNASVTANIVEEFVRRQIKSVPDKGAGFAQTSASGGLLGGFQVGIAPIQLKGDGKVQERRQDKQTIRGYLLVAYEKELGIQQQILLLAAAERMRELAEIDCMAAEIELRSQFLSIASHELKTPLTAIYGMLQLQERSVRLKRDDPMFKDPERQLSYLRRLLKQVERLNELIDGLLDISRIQNNRFMVEPSDVDVANILRETVSSRLEQVAHEANVSLHVEAPESLMAWVDPIRMEEVVTNLTMNAIRFSPEGGVVWVKLRSEGDAFRLTVRDQGPSVPIEDRERIFKPFERAQRTARFGGMGLGLFISRQIAQLHGGNVALVESVPGKGNVFEAHFPTRAVVQASA